MCSDEMATVKSTGPALRARRALIKKPPTREDKLRVANITPCCSLSSTIKAICIGRPPTVPDKLSESVRMSLNLKPVLRPNN